ELFHQPRDSADQEKERLRGVWKDLGGSGDPSRQSAIDSAGPGLAPQYNSPVYLPDGIFVYRSGFGGEFAAPQGGIVVVDGLQMIAQRLASGRDAVFDHFRRLAQRSSLTVRSARHAVSRSSRVSRVQVLASVLVAAAVTAQTPPATLYGPASRSASAAVVPASRRPQAPCTPALSRSETSAVRSPPSPFPCSTPPAACRLACPPAPLPPLPAPLPAPPAASRSLPARSGIPGSSPENRSAPETRYSRPAAIGPDHPSGTSAPCLRPKTGSRQIVLLSTRPGSDTHALLPLPRCGSLPLLLQAPAAPAHPICKSACSRSAARIVPLSYNDRAYVNRPTICSPAGANIKDKSL